MKKNSKFLIFNMILLIVAFLSASLLSQFKSERAYADQTEETALTKHQKGEDKQNPKRLWCNEHGVYEDECYICHPELFPEGNTIRDPKRLWCNEHGVYEDECFICRPGLKSNKSEEQSAGLYCKEHEVFESECGICHPELSNSLSIGQGLKIRLESPESAVKAGIITNVLSRGETMPGLLF